jgi:hypothetical protein
MIRPIVGRVTAHYIALLIYTCFCAYTIQARSGAKFKILKCSKQTPHSGENDRFCARLKTDISASNSGLRGKEVAETNLKWSGMTSDDLGGRS